MKRRELIRMLEKMVGIWSEMVQITIFTPTEKIQNLFHVILK